LYYGFAVPPVVIVSCVIIISCVNNDFLFDFAVPQNPFDTVGIYLEPPAEEEDQLAAVKAVMMAHCLLPKQHMVRLGGDLSPRLLAALRILLLEQLHLDSLGGEGIDPEGAPVNDDNERSVMSVLLSIVEGSLEAFSTSEEEDDRLLLSSGLPPFLRAVVVYRHGLKRILMHTRTLVEAHMRSLDGFGGEEEGRVGGGEEGGVAGQGGEGVGAAGETVAEEEHLEEEENFVNALAKRRRT